MLQITYKHLSNKVWRQNVSKRALVLQVLLGLLVVNFKVSKRSSNFTLVHVTRCSSVVLQRSPDIKNILQNVLAV